MLLWKQPVIDDVNAGETAVDADVNAGETAEDNDLKAGETAEDDVGECRWEQQMNWMQVRLQQMMWTQMRQQMMMWMQVRQQKVMMWMQVTQPAHDNVTVEKASGWWCVGGIIA